MPKIHEHDEPVHDIRAHLRTDHGTVVSATDTDEMLQVAHTDMHSIAEHDTSTAPQPKKATARKRHRTTQPRDEEGQFRERTAEETAERDDDPDVDVLSAVNAANRITRFLSVRDTMSSLDAEELTGVYLGPSLIPLKRSDVMTLCRYVFDTVRNPQGEQS